MIKTEYFSKLDGLRALAALVVLYHHFGPDERPLWYLPVGRIGVVIFFIISGFLIPTILLNYRELIETKQYSSFRLWLIFYFRRALRIFPLYFGAVGAMYCINYAPTPEVIWWHLTYFSNHGYLYGVEKFGNLTHFWSLCVEEQFYLIVPIIILLLNQRHSFAAISLFCIGCFMIKVWMTLAGYKAQHILYSLPGSMEGLYGGILLAYARRHAALNKTLSTLSRFSPAVGVAMLAALAWVFFSLKTRAAYQNSFFICFADLATAMVFVPVVALAIQPSSRLQFLNYKPLRYLGKISYGIYVYHYLLRPFIPTWLTSLGFECDRVNESYLSSSLSSIAVMLIAALSWHCIEARILGLRSLLSPGSDIPSPYAGSASKLRAIN